MQKNKLLFLNTEPLVLQPSFREIVRITGTIVAVLHDVIGKDVGRIQIFEGKNILCDNGDVYVAQMLSGETPTNDFTTGGLKLGTGTTAVTETDTDIETYISNSYKTLKSGYPKSNDDDANNTGAGTDVSTWAFFYDTSEVNVANISEYAICTDVGAPPTAILNHGLFTSAFTKVVTQTLTVFVNFSIDHA